MIIPISLLAKIEVFYKMLLHCVTPNSNIHSSYYVSVNSKEINNNTKGM